MLLLLVADIQGIPSHQLSCGQVVLSDWSTRFCVLENQTLWILTTETMRQVRGGQLGVSWGLIGAACSFIENA